MGRMAFQERLLLGQSVRRFVREFDGCGTARTLALMTAIGLAGVGVAFRRRGRDKKVREENSMT